MPDYLIRAVRPGDASAIARQRARMFADLGALAEADIGPLEAATRAQLEPLIDTGEYFGWLAVDEGDGGDGIVAGVGAFLQRLLPRGRDLGVRRQAYVLNVYTEPAHRRRGLSTRLVQETIAWCRAHEVTRVTLHASTLGRPVYERLGFAATNEMRLDVR
jgi:GNAT superfamily N-acetyltransferase